MKHFLSLIIFVLLSTGCINNKGSDIRRLALDNLWEDPISLSLQTYCLYNYDIPADIHDIVSFLEEYRDSVCDEIMYPGEKIDSIITLLETPGNLFVSFTDSCFLYCPSIQRGYAQYGSPRNWINRRTLTLSRIIPFVCYDSRGRILDVPTDTIRNSIYRVGKSHTHRIVIEYLHKAEDQLYDCYDLHQGQEFLDTSVYRMLLEFRKGHGITCLQSSSLPKQRLLEYDFKNKSFSSFNDDLKEIPLQMLKNLSSSLDSLSKEYYFERLLFYSPVYYSPSK